MERLNFRIKRTNPDVYTSLPCSGGTNYWPISNSMDCSGMSMYNSTGSQILNALSGDIRTFPIELRDCSFTNPCVILWDLYTSATSGHCKNIGNYAYKAFYGINVVDSLATTVVTGESYNNVITLFESLRVNFNKPINITSEYNINYNIGPCNCENGLDPYLNNVTLFLSQDFNDIGHYSLWDGNISQKDTFSNFVFTASTTVMPGDTIKITNTTDFSYYKELQDLPFTIDWGDLTPPTTLSYNSGVVSSSHQYMGGPPMQYRITITQETPWGQTSTSQVITAPNYTYNQLAAIGGIPPNSALTINASGQTIGTGYTSAPSGVLGQGDYIAWDSGTDINEYTGMTQFPNCFEVTGVTESLLGAFQTYTTANSAFLPPGYTYNTIVPIGGDVINPNTNNIETGMYGYINVANAIYTAYTISSANNQTPIDFYDFSNGITLYIAESCGLNALAFGAYDCFECTIEDCDFCETKDEYIDRTTGIWNSISFNAQRGVWSPYTDYQVGDIVFDTTYNTCCCFMAVKDIFQTGATTSDWAGVPPSETLQGVWYQNNIPMEHIWEACSSDCVNCPPGTSTPCDDVTILHCGQNPGEPAGQYVNGAAWILPGCFVTGPEGNCYQALSANSANYPPTAFTSTTYWEYVGCSTWICPQDLNNIPLYGCELVPGTGITTTTNILQGYQYYEDCKDDFDDGECFPDKWVCENQYDCVGCIEIDSSHSAYTSFDPLNPLAGPVFNLQMDCEGWCNPPAFSCTTPTASNASECCTLFSCAEDDANATPGLYTNTVTSVMGLVPGVLPNGLTPNEWLAVYEQFYFTPDFGLSACNAGTAFTTDLGYQYSTSACCDYTGYEWSCCEGCYEVTIGGTYANLQECQQDPATMGGGIVPCGWSCETINQPCVECYDCGCGWGPWVSPSNATYPGYGYSACTADCTQIEQCYVCDCTSMTPCTLQSPCAGIIDNVTWFSGTAQGNIDCQTLCACNAGWDCFIDIDPSSTNYQGPTFCQDGVSGYYMAQNLLGFSNPAPGFTGYSSFSACCEATECCHAECDDTEALATLPGNQQLFPPGNWPCYYVQYVNAAAASSCDPTGTNPFLPYCTMMECTSNLALNSFGDYVCSESVVDDCVCPCDDYMNSIGMGGTVLTPQGQYQLGVVYELHDIVYHSDADSPLCCYVCMLPSLWGFGGIGTGPDCITTFDCSCFIPDDGPATNGTPNPWETCGGTPGLPPAGCQPCGGGPSQTYECTPTGCTPSSCVFNPLFTPASQNCYTGNTCEEHCRASCYCEDAVTDTTNCVVLQDFINNSNTGVFFGGYPTFPPVPQGATHPVYPFLSLDACISSLAIIDCCSGSTSADTWYCDYTSNCESTAGVAGLGCVIVPPNTPGYPGPFTSLSSCTEYCTWECGCPPNGIGNCIFNALSPAVITYDSAFDCWAAFSSCDCCLPPEEWWCDTYGALNGDYSAAVPISACRNSTYFAGQTALYQQGAIGQLVGGPTDPTNTYFDAQVNNNFAGIGFANQAACEQFCRYCCDCAPPGTSNCNDVDWGVNMCPCTNIPSELTPYACEIATAGSAIGYPCTLATTDFYCLDIVGCSAFTSTSPPSTFVSGPHIDLLTCQSVCTWGCGDCISDCFCAGPQPPGTCNPIYYNLDDCIIGVTSTAFFASYSGCCDCYECSVIGSISYTYFDDPMNSWMVGSVTVTPFVGSAPPWVGGTNYSIGDVVTASWDGNSCCYVCVDDDPANLWIFNPGAYYQYYINDLVNNTPVWPGPAGPGVNANNSGTLVWVPCNSSCNNPVQQLTYDCIPGTTTPPPGTCAGKTLIPGGPLGGGGSYLAIQWICDPVNGVPPSTLFSDFYHEGTIPATAANSACQGPNGDALQIPTYVNFYSCPNDPVFQSNYMPFNINSKQQWVNELVAAGLAATTSMDFIQLRTLLSNVCGVMGQTAGGNYCICPSTLCTCTSVVGTGGQYSSIGECNQTLLSDPCCGFWVCENVLSPQTTQQCTCIFDNTITSYNPLIHYYNQSDCENDPTTCCSAQTMTRWSCDQVDCNCIPDVFGAYASQYDCENDPAKCCWTGVTPTKYECKVGNNGLCKCVLDPTGQYTSIADCENDTLNCCWTGMTGETKYECVSSLNGLCKCVPAPFGPYLTLLECQQSHTCCNTGITSTTRYDCKKTVVANLGLPGQTVSTQKCDCVPTGPLGQYASLADCLNDPDDCCWTATTSPICKPCIGTIGHAIIQNEFTGVWAPYNAAGMATPVQGNGSGGVTNWAPGLTWGYNEVTLSPLDGCCYISVTDSGTVVDPTSFYDPSVCYHNFVNGLACDGSTIFAPTPVTTAQSNAGDFSIWWPCDETCADAPGKEFECVNGNCVIQVGGQYSSLQDCQQYCWGGCDECLNSLSSYFSLVPQYPPLHLGLWSINMGGFYANNCVVDPTDDCCYCCVLLDEVNWMANTGGNPNAIRCKGGDIPSQNVGTTTSATYGGWQTCGVDVDGAPCFPDGECECCSLHLAPNLGGWPINWTPYPGSVGVYNYSLNDCVTNAKDGCCWCCANDSGAVVNNGSDSQSNVSNIPCQIINGSLISNSATWMNCGCDELGDQCPPVISNITCYKCINTQTGWAIQTTSVSSLPCPRGWSTVPPICGIAQPIQM